MKQTIRRITSGRYPAAACPSYALSGVARTIYRYCSRWDAGRAWGPACILLLGLLWLAAPVFAVPPGTLIENTADAAFISHGNAVTVVSNTVSLTTQWRRTPARITLLQYAPALSGARALTVPPTNYDPDGAAGGGMQQIAAIYPAGSTTPIDLSRPVQVTGTDLYHQGEPVFFEVTDPDQNIDATRRETVWVLLGCPGQGDNELLLLQETGPDSGQFVGCIQSSGRGPAQSFNGTLDVAQETTITARYTDPVDGADTVATTALVDPFGLVFDSSTGQPVDNVTLTLVDDASGQPARVYGDDGISTFPPTIASGSTVTDSSGRVYTFGSGRYRYPFVPPGRYRLSIRPPAGYGAPSSVATAVLQTLPGAPFIIAEPGSRGEVFVLNPGPAVRMDIPVDPFAGGLWLQKTAARETVAIGDFLQYRLVLENSSGSPASTVTLTDRLPPGFRYRKGSARLDGRRLSDPDISPDGRNLVFGIGNLADGASADIRYVVEVAAGARPGEARNTASASCANGLRANTAFAVVTVKEDLFRSENVIVGRVIADNCADQPLGKPDGVAGVRIYLEDGTYVVTDKQGRYHFEGIASGSHVVQLDLETLPEGMRPDDACAKSARAAGTAFSRFVDLHGGALWREDFHVATVGGNPAGDNQISNTVQENHASFQKDAPPVQDLESVDPNALAPTLAWVMPRPDFHPAIPNLKLAVSHPSGRKIDLLRNGIPVTPLAFEGVQNSSNGKTCISLWSGVGLSDGLNRFTAVCRDADGRETGRIAKEVYYAGPPVKGEVVAFASRLIADGKQTPLIAVRLTDTEGQPVRYGVTGVFEVLPPHQAYRDEKKIQDEAIVRTAQDAPRFTVGRNGIAPIRLKPTTTSGFAAIRLRLEGRVQELRVWLRPEARQWILVGLAEGTAGYNQVTGNMQNLAAADMEEDFYKDGRIAFFAKGKVKGEWLLTAAYDSARDRDDPNTRFFQQLDPDTYYTLYGDTTAQQHEAASVRRLYLKIERDRFYAMFGDFDTGLDVTELSAYSRRFNGFKAAYRGDALEATAFAADTNQAYIRDEIRGNGTSGLYRLSRQDLIINSEKIILETRDRFHSDVVLSAVTLTRHLDYTIDYDNGTLFFKSPVYSRDARFNPIYIVAAYEAEDPSDETYTYGGRAAVTTVGESLRVGATYVHEGPKNAEGNLGGLDARMDMGNGLELKAEIALTRKDRTDETLEGKAFLAQVSKQSKTIDAKAYVREQGKDFGLGHQNGSEAETRKFGLEGAWRVSDRWTAAGELYRQSNLATEADRDVGELDVTYRRQVYQLSAGLRQAQDRFADGTVDRSTQLLAGVSRQFLDNRLKLRANHEQAIGGHDGNVDFPTRTVLGADYQITDPVALFAEHEFTHGRERDTQSSRAGIRATPWKGGQMGTAVGRGFDENGDRLYATLGLAQTWKISEHWRLDGGLDRSQTVDDTNGKSFNTSVPSTSGSQEDFTALSVGAAYTAEQWSWTGRLETRYAQHQDKWGLLTGIAGQVRKGLGLCAGIKWFDTQNDSGAAETDGEVRLSLALRPANSRWTILDRLDFKYENSETESGRTEAHRIVNNFNANYKPNHRIQTAFQYGAKYVFDTFDSHTCEGYTDLTGLELRYELTPRWDAGLHAGALHSWAAGRIDSRTGISVGYNLFKNTWVSAGYNFSGFEDTDFSEADYTAQGPFVKFRIKFDQQSVKEMIDWFSK